MSAPVRLTAVLVHPVQYYAPWFRQIAAECPEIDLTVVYATEPTPEQQGVGFGRAFTWDVPLTAGYRCQVVRPSRPEDDLHSSSFRGVDVAGIGEAVLATRPDVALIPGWYSATLLRAIRACRKAGVPVLYRGDSNLLSAPAGPRRAAWRARTWLRLRAYDGYLATGTRSREYLRSFGVPPWRTFASPHCVDNALFARQAAPFQSAEGRRQARAALGLAADGFTVLFAGKLEPKKRPLDLVHALALLGPGVQLLVVGDGALAAECRSAAASLGVAASFAGFLNQTEMARAYAAADCLALPSGKGETWGLVVNEAMATGLPAVVSDRVGCAPDLVIPGETGEVFPCGDRAALAAALDRVRAAGPGLAPACRERAAAHSFAAATAGLLAACRFAAGERRTAPLAQPGPAAPASRVRVLAGCGGMVTVTGLERMTFEVLRSLRRHGAEVHCVLNLWENHRIVPLAEAVGASWTAGPYLESLDRHARDPRKVLRMALDIVRTSLALLRDARRFRPTHVLMSEFLSVIRNAPALAVLRLLGVPVILRVGMAPTPGATYRKVWRWGVAPFVDRFVADSEFTRGEILAHGIPAARVERIYNTVPLRGRPAAAGPADPGKVVYAGQIIPLKGVDLLLEAVALLAARGIDVRLDVIGQIDGWEPGDSAGYRAGLLARAGRPDLAGRVRFLGWQDDVPALMATAAVHACPSLPEIRESFGVVNLEAKQAGIPSVVFRSGGMPELIRHQVDGWVCDAVTAEALAEGLAFFLADPERRAAAGQAARESLARFSHEAFDAAWGCCFRPERPGCPAAARHPPQEDGSRTPEPRRLAPPGPAATARVLAGCGGMVTVTGLERMTFEVLRSLRRHGAEVHCVLNSWENHRIIPLAEAIGASWTTGPYREPLDRHARNPRKILRMALDIAGTSLALLRDARRFQPTHVLMAEFLSVIRNAPALAVLRLLGVPVILRVGMAPPPGTTYRRVWRWALAPFVDRFVANSEFTRREILAHGIPASRVERIYNAVPLRARPSAAGPTDPGKVVYAGQIIPLKGVSLLLEAVALLAARGIDVRLDVIGQIDGWEPEASRGYHSGLLARAGQPDLAGKVRFLGWQDDVPALMAAAAVHCCPSLPEIREAFGVVNLEAKQAGIPSVVFPSGALPELIRHRVDGWVCDAITAEALAEGLAFFLTDPERRAAAGQAARESLARFSHEAFDAAWGRCFLPAQPPWRIGHHAA